MSEYTSFHIKSLTISIHCSGMSCLPSDDGRLGCPRKSHCGKDCTGTSIVRRQKKEQERGRGRREDNPYFERRTHSVTVNLETLTFVFVAIPAHSPLCQALVMVISASGRNCWMHNRPL